MGFPAKRDGWVVQQQQLLLQPPARPPPLPGAAYPLLPTVLPYSSNSNKKYDPWQHSHGFYPQPYPPPKRVAAAAAAPAKYKSHSRKHNINNNNNNNKQRNRAPCAPYNTSSYLMRAGKLGINAPLLSPTTPALEMPVISPAPWPQESLGDGMVANELGVNAYGSMNGRIRLRAADEGGAAERDSGGFSSCGESDTDHCERPPADSVQQVEERIEHGLQRFEILMAELPLEHQHHHHQQQQQHHHVPIIHDQETHIAQLEEENLCLQQRLWAMSQELLLLRRRLANQAAAGGGVPHEIASDDSLGNGSCAA
ncbi:unnamed protein product [Sphagnum compactum]